MTRATCTPRIPSGGGAGWDCAPRGGGGRGGGRGANLPSKAVPSEGAAAARRHSLVALGAAAPKQVDCAVPAQSRVDEGSVGSRESGLKLDGRWRQRRQAEEVRSFFRSFP